MNREQLDKPAYDLMVANRREDFDIRKSKWKNGFVAGEFKSLQQTNWNGMEVSPVVYL